MTPKVTFSHGRCFFNDFNEINDKDSKTGKSGVNYCRFKFLGAIFSLIGLSYRLNYQENGKKYHCYLYKKSMNEWLKRHKNDPVIVIDRDLSHLIKARNLPVNVEKTQKLNYQNIENYISIISANYKRNINFLMQHEKDPVIVKGSFGCLLHRDDFLIKEEKKENLISDQIENYITDISNNHKKNIELIAKRQINPGTPLEYEQVLEKAKEKFSHHQEKEKVLQRIKEFLDKTYWQREPYKERLAAGLPPYFFEDTMYYEFRDLQLPFDCEEYQENKKYWDTYHIARDFLNSLPGVDVTIPMESCLKSTIFP